MELGGKKNTKNLPFDRGDLQWFLSFSASKTEIFYFQKEADCFYTALSYNMSDSYFKH